MVKLSWFYKGFVSCLWRLATWEQSIILCDVLENEIEWNSVWQYRSCFQRNCVSDVGFRWPSSNLYVLFSSSYLRLSSDNHSSLSLIIRWILFQTQFELAGMPCKNRCETVGAVTSTFFPLRSKSNAFSLGTTEHLRARTSESHLFFDRTGL